tara:strand:- start:145 stop:1488 length:1344 start_codon:yes stop_codon:yes gene_type:complete
VAVIKMKNKLMKGVLFLCVFAYSSVYSQTRHDTVKVYKKRVLESAEVVFLGSYYTQDGDNAAVGGGIGSEKLEDITGTIVISIPLNADDILTIDAGVSTYTSASSSNINPFDKNRKADPFVASSGASKEDEWTNITASYSHSSDDRNTVWSGKASVSSEYDYFSAGIGGSYTKLFNQKNTSLSVNANVFVDSWSLIYPVELRNSSAKKGDDDDFNINDYTITGNQNYSPSFERFNSSGRNSYSIGFGFSQILHKNIQGSLALDFIQQQGLLSTPFQRVYFSDVEDSFIENFQLADDVERLPDLRFKVAAGGRLNWYLNERITLRTFYRYYFDDWGISSHTTSVEIPVKVSDYFTLYPSYRFYNQTASDYFNPYNESLSTDEYYTSDYDVSGYSSNQFGFGLSYTDIFTQARIWKFGLKSIDVKFYQYDRNSSFTSSIVTAGIKIVID